jgi:hypothetical protein
MLNALNFTNLNQESLNMNNDKLLQNICTYLESKGLWERSIQKVLFLLELRYFHKNNKHITNAIFKSYDYGPYSSDITKIAERKYEAITKIPKNILNMLNDIFNEYKLDIQSKQEKEFDKILKYIHSLFIYNVTPFNHKYKLEVFNKDDLLLTIETKTELNGSILKKEKEEYKKIQQIEVPKSIEKILFSGI